MLAGVGGKQHQRSADVVDNYVLAAADDEKLGLKCDQQFVFLTNYPTRLSFICLLNVVCSDVAFFF